MTGAAGTGCVAAWDRLHRIFEQLVDVAPAPGFSRLVGADHRVVGGVEMFGRVLVFRIVAAADVAACQACAQVHPAVAALQAFFAAVGIALAGGDVMEVYAVVAQTGS